MTPRYDGKTAKMEVNELLGRFEKVRIVQALFAGMDRGMPICYKKKSSPFLNEAGSLNTVTVVGEKTKGR